MEMFEQLLNRYSSKLEILKAFEEFKNFQTNDYDQIKRKYFELFEILPISITQLPLKFLTDDFSVYRCRIANEVKDNKKVNSFSYPNPKDFTKTQRANWEGRNVFYGSDSLFTCLSESKLINEENDFYVSKWGFHLQNLSQTEIPFVPYGILDLPINNPWSSFFKGGLSLSNYLSMSYTFEQSQTILSFIKSIGEIFAEKTDKFYSHTAFLSDQALFHKDSIKKEGLLIPFLLYPSVVNDFKSCNLAISPFFVDSYMYLEKIFKVKVASYKDGVLKFNYNQMGIVGSNDEIQWYAMDIDRENIYFQYKSIKCECGANIKIEYLDEMEFKFNNENCSHEKIMAELTKTIDLTKDLENNLIIEEKGILGGLQAELMLNTQNVEILYEGEKHSALTFEINFITPFKYNKIDDL